MEDFNEVDFGFEFDDNNFAFEQDINVDTKFIKPLKQKRYKLHTFLTKI